MHSFYDYECEKNAPLCDIDFRLKSKSVQGR